MRGSKAKKLRKVIWINSIEFRDRKYKRHIKTGQIFADTKRQAYQKLKGEKHGI